jgi:hypothetical protein
MIANRFVGADVHFWERREAAANPRGDFPASYSNSILWE